MRIAVEAQRIFRPKKHGMDIVAIEILKELQQQFKEDEYFVFAQKNSADTTTLQASSNMKIQAMGPPAYPIWEQWYLPNATRKVSAQLLHCTNNTAPIKVNIPLVVTIHDVIYMEKLAFNAGSLYQRVGNVYRRWNVPIIAKKASMVLTVSNYERERIIDLLNLPPEKVKTVYNSCGMHFEPSRNAERLENFRKQLNLPERFVLFLGNTDPKKNLPSVMKALGIILKKGKMNFHLVMPDLGIETLKNVLKEQGNETLLSKIKLTGYIPNRDLPDLYKLSSLFLYPSLRESFGIPILEAMACGTPVITSNTSAMPEVAGEGAFLINPNSAEELAEGILKILDNSDLRDQLIQYGLNRSKQFSWAKTATEVRNCYQQILYP